MPWGVAAVRGTFVMISVSPSGQASVSCLTGSAEVTNGGQTVPLSQNQSTQVATENAPPPPPAAIPPAVVQVFEQVKTWIEETAKTMDQNQEQTAPPPPTALIAALQEVLAPVQQTQAPVQEQQQTQVTQTPAPNSAMSALQSINQALGNIGISVGNNTVAFQTNTTSSTNSSSGTSSYSARLATLSLSHGTLSPAFSPDTLNYTTSLDSDVNTVTLSPTLEDSSASFVAEAMHVSGTGTTRVIGLDPGSNTITIKVIARDGVTQKIYTILVTRLSLQRIAISQPATKLS